MKIREYINKIAQNEKAEDMQSLAEMLIELLYMTKEGHPDIYEDYKIKLYEMAYGKVLTLEMAEEWVEGMNPKAKWTKEETDAVRERYNLEDIDDVCFYAIMNMHYSDMKNLLGNGEDEESLQQYLQATKDWYFDEDIGDGKIKTYNYKKYVAR